MLTEPMTTPPRRMGRIAYGVLVGILFAPFIHLGSIYSTPELALLAGNVFSYLISPKVKAVLKLKEKIEVTPDVYDFVFENPSGISFKPGQYMEWTLGHENQDSRGIRRFFTIASSPTEDDIRVGVKFYDKSSSYKQTLMDLVPGDTIIASQLSGDFTLPRNKKEKLVFIAGGIGVTPFRSLIKYLLDRDEWRDIVFFYSNKTEEEFAYAEVFEEAGERLNFKNIFTISRKDSTNDPRFVSGRIDSGLILQNVPDWNDRTYYISGPQSMVNGCKEILKKIGVEDKKIKTDYFPGLA
jgi:ferredoxin-NADP reductase